MLFSKKNILVYFKKMINKLVGCSNHFVLSESIVSLSLYIYIYKLIYYNQNSTYIYNKKSIEILLNNSTMHNSKLDSYLILKGYLFYPKIEGRQIDPYLILLEGKSSPNNGWTRTQYTQGLVANELYD